MAFFGWRLMWVMVVAGLGVALPVDAITPVTSPAINPKVIQKKTIKPVNKPAARVLPASAVRAAVSPAAMAGICLGLQEGCVVSLLDGERLNGPVEEIYPIEWVWQCAERQMPECSQYRLNRIVKELRSPPAPQPPFVIGNIGYAIFCDNQSGDCHLRYYTDFSQFQWPVWHAEDNCISATPPLPLDPADNPPPPPPCDPVSVDAFQVAIEGQMATVEVGGTLAGCIVPRVQGAYLPTHRNFNRRQEYTEVTANQIAARRDCRGSYRIELRNGRVCNLPCHYSVERLLGGIGGEFGCYISFDEPTCR